MYYKQQNQMTMKNNLFNFYLTNYKSIHHSLTIGMVYSLMFFISSTVVKLPLFGSNIESLVFNFILLYISYKVTTFTLDKSGLNSQIEEEIKKKQTI